MECTDGRQAGSEGKEEKQAAARHRQPPPLSAVRAQSAVAPTAAAAADASPFGSALRSRLTAVGRVCRHSRREGEAQQRHSPAPRRLTTAGQGAPPWSAIETFAPCQRKEEDRDL